MIGNAYLPEVAYNDQQDHVSALGFIYGYIGSVILLIFNLTMVMKPEWYGITEPGMAPRISFLTVGVWWMGFAQVTFNRLPNNIQTRKPRLIIFLKGIRN